MSAIDARLEKLNSSAMLPEYSNAKPTLHQKPIESCVTRFIENT
ncbi:MAG: hypothetical protein ABFS56_29855 [Pseudomonadota bacterium]